MRNHRQRRKSLLLVGTRHRQRRGSCRALLDTSSNGKKPRPTTPSTIARSSISSWPIGIGGSWPTRSPIPRTISANAWPGWPASESSTSTPFAPIRTSIGYSLTGTQDQGLSGEGLTTLFRELKPGTVDAMFDAWYPLRWCLFVEPVQVYRGRKAQLEAVLANEDMLARRLSGALQVVGPATDVSRASTERSPSRFPIPRASPSRSSPCRCSPRTW